MSCPFPVDLGRRVVGFGKEVQLCEVGIVWRLSERWKVKSKSSSVLI